MVGQTGNHLNGEQKPPSVSPGHSKKDFSAVPPHPLLCFPSLQLVLHVFCDSNLFPNTMLPSPRKHETPDSKKQTLHMYALFLELLSPFECMSCAFAAGQYFLLMETSRLD